MEHALNDGPCAFRPQPAHPSQSVRLGGPGLAVATFFACLHLAACGGTQQAQSGVTIDTTSTVTEVQDDALQPGREARDSPLRFPVSASSPLPLQDAYMALADALAADDACTVLGFGGATTSRSTDEMQVWLAQRFGRLVEQFSSTLDRLVRLEPDFALALRGLDLRIDAIDAPFESGRDYLAFGVTLGALQLVCNGANSSDVAFDLFRLATSREAVYRHVFYTASRPMMRGGLDDIGAVGYGRGGTAGASGAVVATQAWLTEEGPTQEAMLSSDSVGVLAEGLLPVRFGEWTPVAQSSTTGTTNGVIDVGDELQVALTFTNTGERWLYSESAFIEHPDGGSGLPDCAMTRSTTGEAVLAEVEPGGVGHLILPNIYLSDTCVGEQRIELKVESSQSPVASRWSVYLVVSEVTVSLAATDFDEDRPGASTQDSTPGIGPDDRVEFRLLSAGPTGLVDYYLAGLSFVARYGAAPATLLGSATLDFRPRSSFESITVQDLDLRGEVVDGGEAITPLDETDFFWIEADMRARFADAEDPRPLCRMLTDNPDTFDAFVASYRASIRPLVERVLRAEVSDVTDAVVDLVHDSILGGTNAHDAMELIDTLRCDGCVSAANDREYGRRALLIAGILDLQRQGYVLGLDAPSFWRISALDGIERLRRAVASIAIEASSYAPNDDEVLAVLDSLDLVLAADDVRAPFDLFGTDYQFRRYLALPVEN